MKEFTDINIKRKSLKKIEIGKVGNQQSELSAQSRNWGTVLHLEVQKSRPLSNTE